jgi:hypothetical protein
MHREKKAAYDRRDLPQGASDRDQLGREKRVCGSVRRKKGCKNTKLHAVCDSQCRPLSSLITAGQISD